MKSLKLLVAAFLFITLVSCEEDEVLQGMETKEEAIETLSWVDLTPVYTEFLLWISIC